MYHLTLSNVPKLGCWDCSGIFKKKNTKIYKSISMSKYVKQPMSPGLCRIKVSAPRPLPKAVRCRRTLKRSGFGHHPQWAMRQGNAAMLPNGTFFHRVGKCVTYTGVPKVALLAL